MLDYRLLQETEVESYVIGGVKQDVDDKTLKTLNYNKKEKNVKTKTKQR